MLSIQAGTVHGFAVASKTARVLNSIQILDSEPACHDQI
jgi:hypothetical protein